MQSNQQHNPLSFDYQYLQLLGKILNHGERAHNRTGHDTLLLRDPVTITIDVANDFPLITSKYVPYKLVVSELLWFIKGGTNIKDLHKDNNHIWDLWATEDGELGPIYGKQWRSFPERDGWTIDQFEEVMTQLIDTPDTRRAIVTAWNPAVLPDEKCSPQRNAELDKQALPPCHWAFKLRSHAEVDGSRTLSMTAYMRSCDVPLGLPFNAPSYATLLIMFAQQLNMSVGKLHMVLDDVHIYDKDNHIEMAKKQLNAEFFKAPTVTIKKAINIDSYTLDDFVVNDYVYTKGIKYSAPAV